MAATGSVDPIHAIARGAPVSLLRIEAGPAPYQVYAKPSIHSFAELKGKTVMLDSPHGITHLYFERMAAPEGLSPGAYDMVYSGATSARFAALVSGSVDATILNTPFNFRAQAAHFNNLPAPRDYAKGIPFNIYSVNLAWAKAHKPQIDKFLAAYAKGVDWFYDPANRQEAVDLLVKKTSAPRKDVEDAYNYYVSLKEFDRSGAITEESVGALLQIMKTQGDLTGSVDLARFYDPQVVGAPATTPASTAPTP
jgi:ABC-type nitrate/sulfonate/bicarbonate transport system substrate-binding protein